MSKVAKVFRSISIDKIDRLSTQAAILFLIAFSFFAALTSDSMPINGDTIAYNQQIDDLDLSERTVHWGHMAIGIVFSKLLPLSTDWSMNVLASILGAMGVTAVFLITYKITDDKISSLVAAIILLVSKTYWQSSVFSEVHLTQTALIWLSFAIWIYNKGEIFAGFCFLFAMLAHPVSAVVLPVFLLGDVSLKRVRKFALAGLPFYIVYLLWYWNDFWFSPRGIFGVLDPGLYRHPPFRWMVKDTIFHLIKDFYLTDIFIFVGFLVLIFSRKIYFWKFLILLVLSAAGVIGFSYGRFVNVQPLFPWIAIVGGIGFVYLKGLKLFKQTFGQAILYGLLMLVITFTALNAGRDIYEERNRYQAYKRLCYEVADRMSSSSIVVGTWSTTLLFERYIFGGIYTGKAVFINPNRPDSADLLGKAASEYLEIWILDSTTKQFIEKINGYDLEELRLKNGIVWKVI